MLNDLNVYWLNMRSRRPTQDCSEDATELTLSPHSHRRHAPNAIIVRESLPRETRPRALESDREAPLMC